GGPEPTTAPEHEPPPRPPPPQGGRVPTNIGPIGLWPQQGQPAPAAKPGGPSAVPERKSEESVLAEDWWSHARPVFELHGYFRTRAELFHNFALGRIDPPDTAVWPQPADNYFVAYPSQQPIGSSRLCTPSEAGFGGTDDPSTLV